MDTPSTQSTNTSSTQIEALKKSVDLSDREALKVLESAAEQSQQTSAQRTGIGSNLNIIG